LLFIDEADAFLGRRGGSMSEGMRGALNAILFRTGDQSRDFSVVLATNRPGVGRHGVMMYELVFTDFACHSLELVF